MIAKFVARIAALCILNFFSVHSQSIYRYNPEDIPVMIHAEFMNWRNKHQKRYETTKEYLFRLQNFYENYLRLVELKLGHQKIFYDDETKDITEQTLQTSAF